MISLRHASFYVGGTSVDREWNEWEEIRMLFNLCDCRIIFWLVQLEGAAGQNCFHSRRIDFRKRLANALWLRHFVDGYYVTHLFYSGHHCSFFVEEKLRDGSTTIQMLTVNMDDLTVEKLTTEEAPFMPGMNGTRLRACSAGF